MTVYKRCEDCGWDCEDNPGRPWEGEHACNCGADGMPCSWCNEPEDGAEPRMPKGFNTDVDKNGRRH